MGLPSRRARRVSETNGYQNMQANKLSVEPKKDTKVGVNRKPGKGMVEIEPKLKIEIKLLKLANKLVERGCKNTEIGETPKETRKKLEADSLTLFAKQFTDYHHIYLGLCFAVS